MFRVRVPTLMLLDIGPGPGFLLGFVMSLGTTPFLQAVWALWLLDMDSNNLGPLGQYEVWACSMGNLMICFGHCFKAFGCLDIRPFGADFNV